MTRKAKYGIYMQKFKSVLAIHYAILLYVAKLIWESSNSSNIFWDYTLKYQRQTDLITWIIEKKPYIRSESK